MEKRIRLVAVVVTLCFTCLPAGARTTDGLVADLSTGHIDRVRVNLNAWGSNLGFETTVLGDDPRIAALIRLVREAEPGTGHKCANVGAIRVFMANGGRIGLGLLPSHDEIGFELRLYLGDEFVGTVSVDRNNLLSVLEDMGVPRDAPSLRP